MFSSDNYALWKAEQEFEKNWGDQYECDYCYCEGCEECDEELVGYYDCIIERMK